jgi:hypothetical protein
LQNESDKNSIRTESERTILVTQEMANRKLASETRASINAHEAELEIPPKTLPRLFALIDKVIDYIYLRSCLPLKSYYMDGKRRKERMGKLLPRHPQTTVGH